MRKKCLYCKKSKFSFLTSEIRDSKDSIIRKCESCGLIFLDSKKSLAPNSKVLRKYYNEDYRINNSLIAEKKLSESEHFNIRLKTQRLVLPVIAPYLKKTFDILEIGCGVGSLLYLLKDYVNSCTGVEINKKQAKFAKARTDCNIYSNSISEIPKKQKFDVIFLISVLEHIKDPFGMLIEMKRLLKPNGFLYIEIPNCNEALIRYLPPDQAKKYKKFFYHKAHLYYFNEEFFGNLLNNCGYQHKVSSRHDYTLVNFLHWWFLGKRQTHLEHAQCVNTLYNNADMPFKKDMNNIFVSADSAFKKVMKKHKLGYILTFIAKPV